MPNLRPTIQSHADPERSGTGMVGIASPRADVEGVIRVLMATGCDWGEALGHASAALGIEYAKPSWDAKTARMTRGERIVGLLKDVAKADPVAANAWLNEGLASGRIHEWRDGELGIHLDQCGWVTSLPDGLVVQGELWLRQTGLRTLPEGLRVGKGIRMNGCKDLVRIPSSLAPTNYLYLGGCVALQSLPAGLQVDGWLGLRGCQALRSLPDGLVVGETLVMEGCTAWDGRIPDDARIGGRIWTNENPDPGISLEEWRRRGGGR